MKLRIKKEFFDRIKEGNKDFEVRDAHITFVCEGTGECLTRKITSCFLMDKKLALTQSNMFEATPDELNLVLEDDKVIVFEISKGVDDLLKGVEKDDKEEN